MIQSIPEHAGVWKKSDPSDNQKSRELAPHRLGDHPTPPPGVYAIPSPADPPASEPPISSKNPSPNNPPVVADHPADPARQTHAHGSTGVVEVVVVVVDPVGGFPVGADGLPGVDGVWVAGLGGFPVVLPPHSDGSSGVIDLPARRSAIARALAFLVPVYGIFSLKIIELIRVISVRIS